jgi:hypothetical protein
LPSSRYAAEYFPPLLLYPPIFLKLAENPVEVVRFHFQLLGDVASADARAVLDQPHGLIRTTPATTAASFRSRPFGGCFAFRPSSTAWDAAVELLQISDSAIDSYPERDLSGMTSRGISKLRIRMDDGEVLVIQPSRAPARLRRDMPWLNQLGFFDAFFAADQRPLEVVALGRGGRIVAGRSAQHGSFTWAG